MVADLKTLIIQQIKLVFGDVKVYDEPVRQGLKTPAFLVLIIDDNQERKLGNTSKWEYAINVTYFPEDDEDFNAECDGVSETFKRNFRYLADKHHVLKLNAKKHVGTLVITFNVKMLVEEIFEETLMETLEFGGVRID